VHFLDQSVAATEIERRHVDLRGVQPGGFLEIAAVVSLQQSLFGYDPNRFVWSRAIDADKLTANSDAGTDQDTDILTLGVNDGDPEAAASLATAYAEAFVAYKLKSETGSLASARSKSETMSKDRQSNISYVIRSREITTADRR